MSNQSEEEIFWSGSILPHAKTADIALFSPSQSPNFEFEDIYDEHLLTSLDSIVQADENDLFVVLHTMGNHWIYSSRYPAAFDIFKPSASTVAISPPVWENKEAILNSYDNSILYADYIIDSAINTIKYTKAVSSVLFLSDHGDDIFDADPHQIEFHLKGSPATLHVPLFVWTSPQNELVYPEKRSALVSNTARKIGTENTFYTLLDLANIHIIKGDSTKSLVSPYFQDSEQKYYDNNKRKAFYYKAFYYKELSPDKLASAIN